MSLDELNEFRWVYMSQMSKKDDKSEEKWKMGKNLAKALMEK